ncbi:DUF58 domain-containing protein [Actinocatenispora comari]|uniref:DUF58 domain-containing protein n=1 Tax=Actinocatenispora comari TaxID=2807577 RepID=A0A8J4EKU8_9ACTN|nr:DUF58 domain-containing protein [Actinocatenispora comari]GIL28612.1 hypothetical protein NUM_38660 [Actinocatenispora comari]
MPTRRGIAVGAVGLVLAVGGFAAGYRELAALGVVAVLALVIALVWAGWPPRLTVEREIEPDRVVAGEPCRATVAMTSTARFRAQGLTGSERLVSQRGEQSEVPVPPVRLPAGRAARTGYLLPTDRRGVLDVGPLEVARQDPLGLVRAAKTFGSSTRVWVHPRSYRLSRVPVGAARSLDGVVDAVQYGSITFHALREYVPGDDLRHVHWRTSARVGELMVREHVDTSLPRIVILVDDRESAHTEASLEEAVSAAASVLLAALAADLTVELHLVGGRSLTGAEAGGGAGRARPYLDLLAEVALGDGALPTAVQKLRQRHRGDTLVLVTGAGSAAHAGSASAAASLDSVGLLRDVYPTVVVAVLGDGAVDRLSARALPGVITLAADDAEEFGARWDAVSAW